MFEVSLLGDGDVRMMARWSNLYCTASSLLPPVVSFVDLISQWGYTVPCIHKGGYSPA